VAAGEEAAEVVEGAVAVASAVVEDAADTAVVVAMAEAAMGAVEFRAPRSVIRRR
jgi:hypothetical protein